MTHPTPPASVRGVPEELAKLHGQIINVPSEVEAYPTTRNNDEWRDGYTYGHRDARHAAAELVSAAVSSVEAALKQTSEQPELQHVGWLTQAGNIVTPAGHREADARLYGWEPVYRRSSALSAPQEPRPEALGTQFRVDKGTLRFADGSSRAATLPEIAMWKKLSFAPQEPRAVPQGLSDERILHLWDTHVAYETNPNRPKQPPLADADKLAFARAVLASAPSSPAEPSEAERVCYEAYQVVGSLLSDLNKFDTPEAQKILDNLSNARMVHDDVLPWPSYASPAERQPFKLNPPPVYDEHYAATQEDAASPAEKTGATPVAWRVRGYSQFKTGKPRPWRYFDGAEQPKVNDPACCDFEPLYASPQQQEGESA